MPVAAIRGSRARYVDTASLPERETRGGDAERGLQLVRGDRLGGAKSRGQQHRNGQQAAAARDGIDVPGSKGRGHE